MFKPIKNQHGMVEAGLAVVLVAVLILAGFVYWRTHHTSTSTTASTTTHKSAAPAQVKTKDTALDTSANDANSSVNDLNTSFSSDTSSSSLTAKQGALQ